MSAARPQQAPVVDQVDLDGELVLFDGTQVHHLAGPAAAVWRLADGSLSLDDLAAVLAEGYSIDSGTAQREVRGVVRQLRELGLLR